MGNERQLFSMMEKEFAIDPDRLVEFVHEFETEVDKECTRSTNNGEHIRPSAGLRAEDFSPVEFEITAGKYATPEEFYGKKFDVQVEKILTVNDVAVMYGLAKTEPRVIFDPGKRSTNSISSITIGELIVSENGEEVKLNFYEADNLTMNTRVMWDVAKKYAI